MSGNIFVSYRRDDSKHVAGRLVDRLSTRFGKRQIFIDVDNIAMGLDFRKVINERVAACELMLVIVGPEWLKLQDETGQRRLDAEEDFVRLEIEAALARDIRVIPLLVDGADPLRAEDLPDSIAGLANRQTTRLNHESFSMDASRLIDAAIDIVGDPEVEEAAKQSAIARKRHRWISVFAVFSPIILFVLLFALILALGPVADTITKWVFAVPLVGTFFVWGIWRATVPKRSWLARILALLIFLGCLVLVILVLASG